MKREFYSRFIDALMVFYAKNHFLKSWHESAGELFPYRKIMHKKAAIIQGTIAAYV